MLLLGQCFKSVVIPYKLIYDGFRCRMCLSGSSVAHVTFVKTKTIPTIWLGRKSVTR